MTELTFFDREGNQYYLCKVWHIQKQMKLLRVIKKSRNGDFICKFIKVVRDKTNTHIYRLQKTQVQAIRGLDGLFEHFEECLKFDFGVDLWVVDPVNRMLETVKGVLIK